jgi:hypothetical protein
MFFDDGLKPFPGFCDHFSSLGLPYQLLGIDPAHQFRSVCFCFLFLPSLTLWRGASRQLVAGGNGTD